LPDATEKAHENYQWKIIVVLDLSSLLLDITCG
jgi:hypothetical protein